MGLSASEVDFSESKAFATRDLPVISILIMPLLPSQQGTTLALRNYTILFEERLGLRQS